MRKMLLAGLIFASAAFGFAPVTATTGTNVDRTILLPTGVTGVQGGIGCVPPPGTNFCTKSQVSRHVRCLYLTDPSLNQDNTTGRFGYVITIQAGWRGDGFALTDITGGAVANDFDIAFYSDLGTCEDEPVGAPAVPIASVPPHSHFDGEAGTIPNAATHAIVTLFGGANAKFRFHIHT